MTPLRKAMQPAAAEAGIERLPTERSDENAVDPAAELRKKLDSQAWPRIFIVFEDVLKVGFGLLQHCRSHGRTRAAIRLIASSAGTARTSSSVNPPQRRSAPASPSAVIAA